MNNCKIINVKIFKYMNSLIIQKITFMNSNIMTTKWGCHFVTEFCTKTYQTNIVLRPVIHKFWSIIFTPFHGKHYQFFDWIHLLRDVSKFLTSFSLKRAVLRRKMGKHGKMCFFSSQSFLACYFTSQRAKYAVWFKMIETCDLVTNFETYSYSRLLRNYDYFSGMYIWFSWKCECFCPKLQIKPSFISLP